MNHDFDEPPEVLDIRVVTLGGVVMVELTGEIDMLSVEEPLTTMLEVLDQAPAGLAVDLRTVDFFGSSGINLLLTVQERAEHEGIPVAVIADQPAVLRPLAMTMVDRQLAMFTDRSDALLALHALPARKRNV